MNRSATPTYSSWIHMRDRVLNPKHVHYDRYGGRGITICERWDKFKNFLADMGERPTGKTLDRYPDPDGNYEPDNCRWATPEEQIAGRGLIRDGFCIKGHPPEAQVLRKSGWRRCSICHRTAERERYRRNVSKVSAQRRGR